MKTNLVKIILSLPFIFCLTGCIGWLDKEETRVFMLNDKYQFVYTMERDSVWPPEIYTYSSPASGYMLANYCKEVYYDSTNIFVYHGYDGVNPHDGVNYHINYYHQFKINLISEKKYDFEKIELTKEEFEILTGNCTDCQYIDTKQLSKNPIGKRLRSRGSENYLEE
jgi:hypothetical protein